MHRCPDCGERFEGNVCTFCGKPVPPEELEPTPQINAEEQPLKQEETLKAEQEMPITEEKTDENQFTQPINNSQLTSDYTQSSYNSQPADGYAQNNYTSQPSYGNAPYQNNAMPNGYTNPAYANAVNARQKRKSRTALIVILIVVGVIIIGLCGVGYMIFRTAVNSEKYLGTVKVSQSIDANDRYLDQDSHCYYTNNDDGTVTIVSLDEYGYYDDFTDEVVDDTYIFNFVIPSEIDGKTVTNIAPIETSNPISSGIFNIHLTIPGTVKTIKSDTFNNTEYITELTLEDGVETLEPDAIVDCTVLKKIHIPESVTNIGEHAAGFAITGDSFRNPVGEREYTRATLCYLYVKEGSAADQYAKDNELYIEYE